MPYLATFRALLLASALVSPVEAHAGADAGHLLTQAFEALGGSGGTLTAGSSSVGGRTMARSLTEQRSEERRVGKECRSRWSPDHKKKKESTTRQTMDETYNTRDLDSSESQRL